MSGGMGDEERVALAARDAAVTAALAASRAAADEVERPPVRGFTDRGERGLWTRIYDEEEPCS